MFAVGHLSLGYLFGKATSKMLKTRVNIPLLFSLSVLPDIDLLIPGLKHRGPTHSIILFILLFIPFFTFYRKKATPYFVTLIQHSFLSDFITGEGAQLLWPFTPNFYSVQTILGIQIKMTSLTNIMMEWVSFLLFLAVMLGTKDVKTFFHPRLSNLLLSIPVFTTLLPTFLKIPTYVPLELMAPHLAYITLFTISILMTLSTEQGQGTSRELR